MATSTNLDRRARKELRRAKKMHGGQVPEHVRDAAEVAAAQRMEQREVRRQRRGDAADYFFDRDRLARLAPAYIVTGTFTAGTIVHAAHGNPFIGAAVTTVSGGIIWVAKHRHLDTSGSRVYAATVIGYAGLWSTLAANGLAWNGSGNAAMLAGAALLAAPFAYKHLWRWIPAPVIEVEDEPEGEKFSWFREAWEQYRPAEADMEDEKEIPNGRQAVLVSERGKKSVEDILNAARLIRSTYDPMTVIVEPVSARRALLTVLERDVFQDANVWTGPTLDPKTGIFRAGKYGDGETTHGQFWAPRSGTSDIFVAGTKGSGKTEFLKKLACELHLSPFAVSWVSDPQEGQCLSDFIQTVDRYAIGGLESGIEQNMRLLRGLRRVVFRRSRYFGREIEWIDHKGRERKGGKNYFDPTEPDVNGLLLPALYAFLDEMHVLVKHPEYGEEALRLLGDIIKLSRKTGVGIAYVTHAPSQNEMGGHNASIIRNLLREGMVVAFRTGEPVAQRMLGLSEDPSKLPERFDNGDKSYGLGLIGGGPDGRQTRFRAEYVEDSYAIASQPAAGVLDPMSAEAADQPDEPERAPKTFVVPGIPRPAVPVIPTNAEKQTWADKVLPVFADGLEHSLGAVIKAFPPDVPDRSIRWGLKKLVKDGLLYTDGDKRPYRITDAGRTRLEQLRDTTAVA